MRKQFLLVALFFCAKFIWAVDKNYYSSYIDNKSGSALFAGIHDVAGVGFKSISYGDVWVAYKTTDTKSDGTTIYDYYSYCSNYTYYYSQDGKAEYNNSEGDCYNREHSIPKSWFGGSTDKGTPGTDLFHLVPADKIVNSLRNNHPYGEVTAANATSKTKQDCGTNEDPLKNYNRYGVGSPISIENTIISSGSSTQSPSVKVFEPLAEYKGDLARGYFGTLVKWAGDYDAFTTGDGSQMFSGNNTAAGKFGLTSYGVALLLKWHREDPVSQREIDRNNGIQQTQGNRNPFIDYPILAEYIWGKYAGETFALENAIGSFEEGFVVDESDGDKNGSSPITTYSVSWMANGSKIATTTTRPTDPDNCSASRVFCGWTGIKNYSDDIAPADMFTTGNPTITQDTTFYAVYANKETSGTGTPSVTTFTFSENSYSDAQEVMNVSKDNVTITFDKGTNSNKPKYYDKGSAIRCYGGNTITVTATGISQIVFTFASGEGSNAILATPGTYNEDTKTWTGSANEVVFTIDGTTGHRRIATISVTAGGSTTTYSAYGLMCIVLPNMTVTFHKNDGSEVTKTQIVPQSISTALEANTWVRNHYVFLGWATTENGSVEYENEAFVTTATDMDLYAIWKEEPQYTVTFINNSALYSEQVGYEGELMGFVADPEACEGYEFYGWGKRIDATDNTIEPEETFVPLYIPEKDTTVYAIYTREVTEPGISGAAVGTILWAEDFGGFDANEVPSSGKPGTPTVYGEANVTYSCSNGTGTSTTQIYAAELAGGTSPEILIARSDGYFSISGIPTGKAEEMTLTFKTNKSTTTYCTVSSSTEGITIGTQTISEGTSTCNISNDDALETFNLTITNTNSSQNGREDDFILVVKTSGSTPDITTTYYITSLSCSGELTAIGEQEIDRVARKLLINGQLFILIEDQLFDITGRRVR